MAEYIEINPYSPVYSDLKKITKYIESGKLIVYPTNSGYAFGCKMGMKKPLNQIKKIRNLSDKHNFTMVCKDLSQISHYAKVNNSQYRILKRFTKEEGYTFILQASSKVPSLMLNKSKKTIGIRVPIHKVGKSIIEHLNEPIISSSLILDNIEEEGFVYADNIFNVLKGQVDLIIDGGFSGIEHTSVIDLTEDTPKIIRYGSGDCSFFE